jgi:hypothetical protein
VAHEYLRCLRGGAGAAAVSRGPAPAAAAAAAAGGAGAGATPGCDLKALSRAYLECRMAAGLMAPESLDRLGFSSEALAAAAAAPAAAPAPAARVAGLAALRAAKGGGVAFGLSLPSASKAPP